jgi:SecY interacting protein Syd
VSSSISFGTLVRAGPGPRRAQSRAVQMVRCAVLQTRKRLLQTTLNTKSALTRFVTDYQAAYPQLTEIFDSEWRSPCECGEPFLDAEGIQQVPWQPLARRLDTQFHHDFVGLERALEITVHQDIKDYYAGYWSGGLEADAPQGPVSLIQLWNAEDADRLIENLLGHALAKRRARSPFTVFFACTEEDSELFLSVDNTSGAVVLEKPGYKPIETVAGSLAEFLCALTPAPPERHPERATT